MAANMLLILSLTIIITTHSPVPLIKAQPQGFSVDLIHRDSANSPFHNPRQTPPQRLRNALTRSISRLHHFSKRADTSAIYAPITAANGEYLVNISIGTPPFHVAAVADTGSNLIWTQCKPCVNCYKQYDAVFDPQLSSTYKPASCDSEACQVADGASCGEYDSTCGYSARYGDGSSTTGDVALETLTLGSTDGGGRSVALRDTVMGCGRNNSGLFQPTMSGIVGLGGGPASLVSQLGSTIAGKFSYCLVPYGSTNLTSTLSFGQNAVISGAVKTPLVSDTSDSSSTFYYVKLDAFSIGSERLPFINSGDETSSSGGNIIVDSGTTLTIVPQDFANTLRDAIERQVTSGKKVKDPTGLLGLCYEAGSSSDLVVPTITVHFDGGVDVKLTPENMFVSVSNTVMCLAVRGDDGLGVSIYGNIAQQNFRIGYDLEERTLSFKQADCTKH